MLNLRCGQYIRNPFFPGFWGQKSGCGLCILADYTQLYTVMIVHTLKVCNSYLVCTLDKYSLFFLKGVELRHFGHFLNA